MVKTSEKSHVLADGSINLGVWLDSLAIKRDATQIQLIRHACILSQLTGETVSTITRINCFHQGLMMAEMLDDLAMDHECIAAAVVYPAYRYADLSLDDIDEHLGEQITKLIKGTRRMDAISGLLYPETRLSNQNDHFDKLKKMLLAMADDVRVVIIKLVERASMLRCAKSLAEDKAHELAQETLTIYAPLANRLGIGQLKWELEDRSFRFLEPESYKAIAKNISEKRLDRDRYINQIVDTLTQAIEGVGIKQAETTGRAKHIYSIYKKMQRKQVDFEKIYDVRAVRVLVPTIEDCYAVLGIVHSKWQHIPEEFDDYITAPKANGYQSLHTAVIGPEGKHVEVQIRTYEMHQDSELGVAAHWRYKEGSGEQSNYEEKINWLRQVLAWQKEVLGDSQHLQPIDPNVFEDRIYVFTPKGEIIDLPFGATALDFAYHIHSEIGHRCRGAKVNGQIVTLTRPLQTGEEVEILTTKRGSPSRDWLNPQSGYLRTARAKAKVHHWFKKQDFDRNYHEGQQLLDKERKRQHISDSDLALDHISLQLNYKNVKDMIAALGAGDIRVSQITNLSKQEQNKQLEKSFDELNLTPSKAKSNKPALKGINIDGVTGIVTSIARCCSPVPGDDISGYITKDRGISIHRSDCDNLLKNKLNAREKMVKANWGDDHQEQYSVDLHIRAHDRKDLIYDITQVLSQAKVNLVGLNTVTDSAEQRAYITLTIEINNLESLTNIIDKIKQLPNIINVSRLQGN